MFNKEKFLKGTNPRIYESFCHYTWLRSMSECLEVERGNRKDRVAPDRKVVLSYETSSVILAGSLVCAEEKMDGILIGFQMDDLGNLRVMMNRNQYLKPGRGGFALEGFWQWFRRKYDAIVSIINPNRVLWGVWCEYTRTVQYENLPSYFFGIDIYDIDEEDFLSSSARDSYLGEVSIEPPPFLFSQLMSSSANEASDELDEEIDDNLNQEGSFSADPYGIIIRVEDAEQEFGRFIMKVDDPHLFRVTADTPVPNRRNSLVHDYAEHTL